MAHYTSDGKKLINVEYDVIPRINDYVDGMMMRFRVISHHLIDGFTLQFYSL